MQTVVPPAIAAQGKSSAPIDRHKNLSQKEFLNEYVIPGKPVILTEAANSWPAMKKWTPDFFKSKYGHIEREVRGKKYKIGDYIELMFNSSDENPSPYPYNFNVEYFFPELLDDIQPKLIFGKMDRISHPLMPKALLYKTHAHEIFFGGRGAYFPLHFDAMFMHTQITQIFGDKEFFMFAPDQSEFLYPEKENPKQSQMKNIFKLDIEKFPLFKKASPVIEMIHQGETLFFPTHWWHTTRIPGASITYGRAQLNSYNWNAFLGDYLKYWKKEWPVKSRVFYTYGKVLGQVMNVQEFMS